ncbi:MAG TPA: hypothetical protein VGM23_09295, partial [Armatimonadota bacterium]
MSIRYFVLLLALTLGMIASAQADLPPVSTTVTIKPGDTPADMAEVRALLSDNADRLRGDWPWKPPSGDPAKITKADYLAAVRAMPGYLQYLEQQYGTGPIEARQYAYEAIPVFVALWKATGERNYLEMTVHAVKMYCRQMDDEVKQYPEKPPNRSYYWVWAIAYVVIPVLELQGTPEYAVLTDMLGKSLGNRAAAWPIYDEHGAQNRAIDPAFWYEVVLKFNPNVPHAAEMRAYADRVWNEWWPLREIDEDDSWYTVVDMAVLHAWCLVRGVSWWKDAESANLWRHYAAQIANDGTWPAYGDGGVPGGYCCATWIAELAASRTRDHQLKWLAHRAFWNGRERLPKLTANIGYMNCTYLAMAYLFADDTVKEAPPAPGVTTTKRRFREIVDIEQRYKGEPWFILHKEWMPSKIIFRAGSRESDQFLMVQAANQGGHGHPDSGHLIHYGAGGAYYLSYGTLRPDASMEGHNDFTLRDPKIDAPWPGRWSGLYATEGTSV